MFSFLKKMLGGETVDLATIKANGAIVIDVRTPAEFKNGHGKKAINIPLGSIGGQIKKIKAYQKPIIVCCKSGMRSGQAKRVLKAQGIEVYNGGAWQSVEQL